MGFIMTTLLIAAHNDKMPRPWDQESNHWSFWQTYNIIQVNTNICSNVFDIARKRVIFKDEADIYMYGIINVWFAQFIEW